MVLSLTTTDHSRDSAGLKYVYPVFSRRAGGLSVGVNFNTNNACNWRCLYCQVPNLSRGSAPDVDLPLLEEELRFFLNDVLNGDFYQRFQVDEQSRAIKDIALSGNGEPTSVKNFVQAVTLIAEVVSELKILPTSHFVLITNGSLIHQQRVQAGLKVFNSYGGEVWFKLDSATKAGRALINQTGQRVDSALTNLKISSALCTTKLQTCLLDIDAQGFSIEEQHAYLNALRTIKETTKVNEIMLYTLARPSMQPEAGRLQPLSLQVMHDFADNIRQLGFEVKVSC